VAVALSETIRRCEPVAPIVASTEYSRTIQRQFAARLSAVACDGRKYLAENDTSVLVKLASTRRQNSFVPL
jgi:hypothetical protein